MKAIDAKPVILNGEKLKAFPLKSEQDKDVHIRALLVSVVLELLDSAVKEEKERKVSQIGGEGSDQDGRGVGHGAHVV